MPGDTSEDEPDPPTAPSASPERARTDGSDDGSSLVTYGIEDRPPLLQSLGLGIQHYLTMVGANIAVPLILAGAMGMPDQFVPRFVGTFFVVSGIATLAQTTLGNRYPIVQGAPFSMLAPALAIVGVVVANPLGGGIEAWRAALLQLQGAIVVAALFEVVIGYLGLVGRLRRYFSPVVIAPVIVLIGLTLFSAPQVASATQNWPLLLFTFGLIAVFSQFLGDRSRAFQLFPVLLGIVVAYVVALALSAAGVYAPGTPGYVDLTPVVEAPLAVAIYPLQWGVPQVTTSFVVGMLAGVIASIIESLGDYHAVARLSGVGAPSEKRITHGIGMEGIANVFAGVMGAGGSTSYSENIGAIGLTGVASRYVVQVGAAAMLVVGFFGPFGALIASIPAPVVGGLYVAMFGQIVGVGLSNLKYVDLDSQRNLFVLGVSLFAGLFVPEYFGNVAAAAPDGMGGAAFFAQSMAAVPALGAVLGADVVANTVFVVGSTGISVGGIVAFALDNLIPGTDAERGLADWAETAEADEDFASAYDRVVRGGDGAERAD
jgi:xanthine/uracil permease